MRYSRPWTSIAGIALGLIVALDDLGCTADEVVDPVQPGGAGSGMRTGGVVMTAGTGGSPAVAGSGGAGFGVAGAAGAPRQAPRAGSGGLPAPSVDEDAGAEEPRADAGGDAAVTGAPGLASATLSDSFEHGAALDDTRYDVASNSCSGDGTVTLDSSEAHSGTQSVRVQASGGYCNHVFLRPKELGVSPSAALYGRVYVKLMSPLAAGHTTFMAMHDARENKDLRFGGQNEVLIWNRESDDATLPELSPTGVMMSAAVPAGEWHCLEWSVDPVARTIQTWLDERAIPGLTLDGEPTADVDSQWLRKADWMPQLDDLRLGWESYGDQANTLWFDDLALGPARLGCAASP